MKSRCVLARENRGTFLAIYIARVRITVHAEGTTIVREGHGSGEGRGDSPGEVHDIALKAAETDATKRALATFGKPFGLELYRKDKKGSSNTCQRCSPPRRSTATASCRLTPRRHDADPSALALLRAAALRLDDEPAPPGSGTSQKTML